MDVVSVEDDLSGYKVVIAPLLYMTKPGVDERLRQFVAEGGSLVTTFLSGLVNENDLVFTGGYPGKLRDILGIWVEETDALPSYMKNSFSWNGKTYESGVICDICHMEHAKELAVYEKDFYAGTPVLSENSFGKGKAYYVATRSDAAFYSDFLQMVLDGQGVQPVMTPCEGVEASLRQKDGRNFLFLLNHKDTRVQLPAEHACQDLLGGREYAKGEELTLEGKGVMILAYE